MDEQRLDVFLNSISPDLTDELSELEEQALADYVPIIRKDMQRFLKLMLAINRPQKILEVGTAVGFSALLMHTYNPVDCHITTIENYDKRIPIARENFKRFNAAEDITLLEGDANEVLKTLDDKYDFIFMDAAKGQYIFFFEELKRLCKPGTIIVTDNVLQEGDIIESHFVVERRNRTIHKRMREFLYEIWHDPDFTTDVLPIADGVCVSVAGDI